MTTLIEKELREVWVTAFSCSRYNLISAISTS